MSKEEKPTAAFIISLLSGIFIILGGVTTIAMSMAWNLYGGWCMGPGMMGRMWRWWGFEPSFTIGLGIFGLISGVIVVISSIMLDSKPENHVKWGTLILIFSMLSIFGGMGGWIIGWILGVIGGLLAITWKKPT